MVSTEAKYCPDEYEHPSSDLMYVVCNIPGPGVDPEDFELEYYIGCSCNQDCKDQCSCTRGTQNYINEKLAIDNKNTIIECNTHCQCVESCGNRLVQFGPLNCLLIMKATNELMGYGLFTKKLIEKGKFICEYAGEVIGIDEASKRLEENKSKGLMNYVLVVSEYVGCTKITTCIDPAKFGNIGRYANHSREPNSILVPVRVDIAIPKLCLFAIKDIEPMSEITFNYAGEYDAVDSVPGLSETSCLCGSEICNGRLPHCPL
ncbi:hypothetical protein QAD02_021818 [Eretmocerus hayati]|uniref:Uncharacterized protein n=1 Tax=Eretmocerus hayati TaxID=131215 RepID=A0ACC2PW39_9HYME|nr:hypothetical protein QAD02_021818 [Eretmocerus hayati]